VSRTWSSLRDGAPGRTFSITVVEPDDVVRACATARSAAEQAGISSFGAVEAATATAEVTRNIVSYAGRGLVEIRQVDDGRHRGIVVLATDDGPGIDDIHSALGPAPTTGLRLGLGLRGARRLMDVFTLESHPGAGTRIEMAKWVTRWTR